ALGLWLLVELLTTCTASSPSLAVFGEWEQQEGLLTSLALAGVWLAARDALRDARDWERTLDVFLGASAAAAALAYLQALGADPIRWAHVATISGKMRPFGTLGHP